MRPFGALFPVALAALWLLALVPASVLAQSADDGDGEAEEAEDERRVVGTYEELHGDEELLDEYDDGHDILEERHRESRERRRAEQAEREEERRQVRDGLGRAFGSTLMHASTDTAVTLWLTHGNDDLTRVFHDLHGHVQVGFTVDDTAFAAFAMWGLRWQASSVPTGLDALWLGGKMQLPGLGSETGAWGLGLTLGLPANRQIAGEPVVFADHANALTIVDDFTLDAGLFATFFIDERAGLNLHLNVQFPFGMPRTLSFNGGAEMYVRAGEPAADAPARETWDGWGMDYRAGLEFSTAFTPLAVYAEVGPIYEDTVRFAARLAVLVGTGPNLGNASDVQLLLVAQWRIGAMQRRAD